MLLRLCMRLLFVGATMMNCWLWYITAYVSAPAARGPDTYAWLSAALLFVSAVWVLVEDQRDKSAFTPGGTAS